MKKASLLLLFVYFISAIFAHEVSLMYSLRDENQYNDTEDKGFKLNYAAFSWGDNDFTDYALTFSISELSPTYTSLTVNKAWLKFPVIKGLELRVGKQYHDFGNLEKSGSC